MALGRSRLVREAYKLAVGQWGIAPSEFWAMHPAEFWWLMQAKKPIQMYGDLTEYEVEDLFASLEE